MKLIKIILGILLFLANKEVGGYLMYEIEFYNNKNKKIDCKVLLNELRNRDGKNSRIRINKINNYFDLLSRHGLYLGKPYIKKLDSNIRELRPIRYRILFFQYSNKFVMLHWFLKKTNKTPKNEIELAINEMKDYLNKEETK